MPGGGGPGSSVSGIIGAFWPAVCAGSFALPFGLGKCKSLPVTPPLIGVFLIILQHAPKCGEWLVTLLWEAQGLHN